MSRFVDIECTAVTEVIGRRKFESREDIQEFLDNIPTADVVEVKHGYWKPSPDGVNPIRCSECNMPAPMASGENEFGDFVISRYSSSYCHECGAKMDGGKKVSMYRP